MFEFAAEMKKTRTSLVFPLGCRKTPYQDQSKVEFLARRAALLQMGIPLRNIIAKQKEIQPQLSDPEPAAGAMVKLGGQYEVDTVLGEGTYGKVLAGRCWYGSPCALKIFNGVHARVGN